MKLHELKIISFDSSKTWEAWLAKHYSLQEGVWLKIYKKDSGVPTVTYQEALDVALCYGWIDGLKKSFDAQAWIQKFTPRRARSVWSKRNQEHVDRLIKAGKMRESGLKEVEAAKADGRWAAAYDSQSVMAIPADFAERLDKNPKAKMFFESLNKQNKYAILYRLQSAKRPETRTKRMQGFITMLLEDKKIYP